MTLLSNMYKILWLINYLQAATACIPLEYTTVSFQGINFACMLSSGPQLCLSTGDTEAEGSLVSLRPARAI